MKKCHGQELIHNYQYENVLDLEAGWNDSGQPRHFDIIVVESWDQYNFFSHAKFFPLHNLQNVTIQHGVINKEYCFSESSCCWFYLVG
jgi:hypothetical protein